MKTERVNRFLSLTLSETSGLIGPSIVAPSNSVQLFYRRMEFMIISILSSAFIPEEEVAGRPFSSGVTGR